jgi:hypothetical protein
MFSSLENLRKMSGALGNYPSKEERKLRTEKMNSMISNFQVKDDRSRLGSSKLENEQRLNRPAVMPPQSLERQALVGYLRAKAQEGKPQMSDIQKPQYVINSLDKQNNDPMKGNLLDAFRGATDYKPIPSATFSGVTSNIPVTRN